MCDWMIILYIYANQEVSLCGNMAIQVELYICAFYTYQLDLVTNIGLAVRTAPHSSGL